LESAVVVDLITDLAVGLVDAPAPSGMAALKRVVTRASEVK
jgi:hypothetical protein